MDYIDADFWSTSAQLLIVLWLIIAVETKPTTAGTAMYRERAEQSKLIKALYQSQAVMIIVAGAFHSLLSRLRCLYFQTNFTYS